MRILAIRGENLASLKAPFEIDLTAEPLASAGLFAITGETGAGKSTLLDALCLALYSDCPRLAQSGVNDDVPDASGDSIKAKDARAILRRGAAAGFAEVDFVARDGLPYRARWAARRARGRADGRLQAVERSLTRLSDGQVLDSLPSAVNARVAEITGLAFDEFRRTVLLAQGDFDAFLTAGTSERAALLEKVTGTQRYRDISRRVFERHGEARDALKALENQRAGAQAMSDEARAALMAQRAALTDEVAALAVTIAAQTRDIDAHVRLTAARGLAEEALAAEARARENAATAAPDRIRLRLLEAALGLRAEHERASRAAKAVDDARFALAEAERKHADLLVSEQEAEAMVTVTMARLDEAERVFKVFGPEWSRATALDGQIRVAARENADAEIAALQAAEAVGKKCAERDALVAEHALQRVAREEAEAALAARPGVRRLAEQWELIETQIEERATLARQIAAKQAEAAEARTEADMAAHLITELDTADQLDREGVAIREEAARTARARLRAIAQDDPAARMARLLAADAAVRAMLRADADRAAALVVRAKADADVAAARHSAQASQTAAAAAAEEAARARAALDALAAPLDLAEAAVSDQAAHLRRHLVAGEPCPVCGATVHPVSEDAVLSGLARDLRARFESARAAQTVAERRVAAAQTEAERARLAGHAAGVTGEQAEARAATAGDEFERARAEAVGAGLTALRETAACAPAALTHLQGQLGVRRAEIEALQAEQSALRDAVEAADTEAAALRAAIEARATAKTTMYTRRSDADRRADLADQAAEQARERVTAIDQGLAPVLAAVGRETAALDTDPEAERTALHAEAAWFREQELARTAASDASAALAPRIAAAEAEVNGAAAQAESANIAAASRRAQLEALRRERAGLLGGEATEAHRTRCNATRLEAQRARDAAAEALSTVRGARAGAEAQATSLSGALSAAQAEQGIAETALAARLADSGLPSDGLDTLIAEAATEASPLRARLKAVDDALTSAAAAAQARRADLRTLMEADAPHTPEPELRAAREAAEAARSEAEQQAGVLTGKLEADDAVRASLADLAARIAGAKYVCDTWAAVNEAVGSAQGDKFARIAQGVTLSILVERANRHLGELKPRYRLTRGGPDLALHVVDSDMGDEVRSTRSLSGGERFLVSLALALALSGMGARGGLAATLFIDEGFGSLDADSLDIAIDALETLQAQGRMVGVISHVEAMKERIPVQIRVVRHGAGMSSIEKRGLLENTRPDRPRRTKRPLAAMSCNA